MNVITGVPSSRACLSLEAKMRSCLDDIVCKLALRGRVLLTPFLRRSTITWYAEWYVEAFSMLRAATAVIAEEMEDS